MVGTRNNGQSREFWSFGIGSTIIPTLIIHIHFLQSRRTGNGNHFVECYAHIPLSPPFLTKEACNAFALENRAKFEVFLSIPQPETNFLILCQIQNPFKLEVEKKKIESVDTFRERQVKMKVQLSCRQLTHQNPEIDSDINVRDYFQVFTGTHYFAWEICG